MFKLARNAAFVATLFASSIALACERPVAMIYADLTARIPMIASRVIQGPEAAMFVRAYNESPPVSNFVADTLVIFTAPGRGDALVVFAQDACAVHHEVLPLALISAILAGRLSSI